MSKYMHRIFLFTHDHPGTVAVISGIGALSSGFIHVIDNIGILFRAGGSITFGSIAMVNGLFWARRKYVMWKEYKKITND